MKVILSDDVRNVGRRGDVKEVNDGYARNFLFPNKLAEMATAGALKKVEAMKADRDRHDSEIVKHLQSIAHKISEMKIRFQLKMGPDGSVFGSINKDAILKALREHNVVTKERIDVILDRPLKALGEYTVPLDLKKGVTTQLVVVVASA